MTFAIKRVYDDPSPDDGYRVLVERLWPRGVAKATAQLDEWDKQIAPSPELRTWFGHDPARFDEFRTRYLAELSVNSEVTRLRGLGADRTVTLVYATRDRQINGAVVLLEALSGEA